MVLLVQKIYGSLKLSSKLDGHHHHHHNHHNHHHHPEPSSENALQSFKSDVFTFSTQLAPKPGSEFFSLQWVRQCLDLLTNLNKAFAKLVVAIDYPMSKWEVSSIEDYLSYSLKLLDLLNLVSSSVSHLGHSRVKMTHALTRSENSPMSPIRATQITNLKKLHGIVEKDRIEKKFVSGEDRAVQEALTIMRGIGFWICGIVLSVLSGDVKPYLELKKSATGSLNPPLTSLEMKFSEAMVEENWVLEEVREVNAAAAEATGKNSGAAGKLGMKLDAMEQSLDAIGKETSELFSEILCARNELIDGLRRLKN